MKMIQIREKDERIIFQCDKTLEMSDVVDVKEFIEKQREKQVVINLEGVSSIKNSTLKVLKEIAEQNKLSLCSLDADVHALLNIMNYDNVFHIFPTEESVFEDRYELKNRRFKVV